MSIPRISSLILCRASLLLIPTSVSDLALIINSLSSFNAFTNLLWGSLLLLYPLLAFRAIRKKDTQSHRSWMVRAYAVAAGPAAHRLFFFLTPIIGDFGVSVMVVILGEAVIRKVRL